MGLAPVAAYGFWRSADARPLTSGEPSADARYGGFRSALGGTTAAVFLTDHTAEVAAERFFQAQYALAPTLLDAHLDDVGSSLPDHGLFVCDFASRESLEAALRRHGLRVVTRAAETRVLARGD
jgi:hypothetical protein